MVKTLKFGYQLGALVVLEYDLLTGQRIKSESYTSKHGAIRTPNPIDGVEVNGEFHLISSAMELAKLLDLIDSQIPIVTFRVLARFKSLLPALKQQYQALTLKGFIINLDVEGAFCEVHSDFGKSLVMESRYDFVTWLESKV